jgi:hyperosmotically inducible protein
MFLIALLLGFILGAAVTWYVVGKRAEPAPETPVHSTATTSSVQRAVEDVKKAVGETADSVRTAIDAKLDIWHLKADDIKAELAAKGKVVRRQTRETAEEVKDAARDTAITTAIKSKYAVNKDVSALNVSVSTTDGVVTLAGSASSYEAISKAMLIAMETEGVRQVVSTIQVK